MKTIEINIERIKNNENLDWCMDRLERAFDNFEYVNEHYIKKDINHFMKKLKEKLKSTEATLNGEKVTDEFTSELVNIIKSLELLAVVCLSKKLTKNRTDLKVMANKTRELANKMEQLSKMPKEEPKEKVENDFLEEIKELLKNI